jgi:hypothetical protein
MSNLVSFVKQHLTGWISAAVLGGAGLVANNVYQALIAQGQAYAAANQVDDSMASWMLHQQTSYGDVIPNLIMAGTFLIVFICLLPTIKHAIRLATTKD